MASNFLILAARAALCSTLFTSAWVLEFRQGTDSQCISARLQLYCDAGYMIVSDHDVGVGYMVEGRWPNIEEEGKRGIGWRVLGDC